MSRCELLLCLLLLLCAVAAQAAECTAVTVTNKALVKRGNRTQIVATLSFAGDTVSKTADYTVSGAAAADDLRRIAHEECRTAEGFAAIALGAITPLAPTPRQQAILDALEARQKLRNLNQYQSESGHADGDTLGSSSITFAAARAALTADAEKNISNAGTLATWLTETR